MGIGEEIKKLTESRQLTEKGEVFCKRLETKESRLSDLNLKPRGYQLASNDDKIRFRYDNRGDA